MSYGLRRAIDPFHEDPLPKAFYYPSSLQVADPDRKNRMSPERLQHEVPNPKTRLTPEEEAFLRGSYHYQKPHKLPRDDQTVSGHGAEDNSSKFDESWPASERPSTISIPDGSPTLEEIKQSAKSRGSISTILSSQSGSSSPAATLDGIKSRLDFSHITREDDFKNRKQGYTSTMSKYIERFRSGKPMSRDEREQSANQRDFWWLSHTSNISTPPSSSTPKEGEELEKVGGAKGRTRSRLSKEEHRHKPSGRGNVELTRKNVDLLIPARAVNPWGLDEQSRLLQDRADQLLEKTSSSLHSSDPAVSTDGLGHSPDTTVSSTEPSYRPRFIHNTTLDTSKYGRMKKPVSKDEDILYQWRIRRRMEVAKGKLVAGPGGRDPRTTNLPGKMIPDAEIDSKLAEFRERLAGGSTVPGVTNFTPAPHTIQQDVPQPSRVTSGVTSGVTSWVPIASPHISPSRGTSNIPPSRLRGSSDVPAHLHLSCDILPHDTYCQGGTHSTSHHLPVHNNTGHTNQHGQMKTPLENRHDKLRTVHEKQSDPCCIDREDMSHRTKTGQLGESDENENNQQRSVCENCTKYGMSGQSTQKPTGESGQSTQKPMGESGQSTQKPTGESGQSAQKPMGESGQLRHSTQKPTGESGQSTQKPMGERMKERSMVKDHCGHVRTDEVPGNTRHGTHCVTRDSVLMGGVLRDSDDNLVTDNSFEELKSQHLQSLKSEELSDGQVRSSEELRSSEEGLRYNAEMIPEKDIGPGAPISGKVHIARKQPAKENKADKRSIQKEKHAGHREEVSARTSRKDISTACYTRESGLVGHDSDSQSLTEVSDVDETLSRYGAADTMDKVKQSGAKNIDLQPRGARNESVNDSTHSHHSRLEEHRTHSAGNKPKQARRCPKKGGVKKMLPAPQDHSSPKRHISTAIGQAVKNLLSSSVSTDSEPSLRSSLEEEINKLKAARSNTPRSRSKVKPSGTGSRMSQDPVVMNPQVDEHGAVKNILIGGEMITLSDGEDFPDDDLLQDLRKRREYFLKKLVLLNNQIENQ